MIDPRTSVIYKRLKEIKKIFIIASSKGGVGKTLISILLSMGFRDLGFKTGLLDIDFTNPSCHILFNIDPSIKPTEEKGLIPPTVNGVRFMTISYFIGESGVALRGQDVDNIFREILAITRWNDTEYLIIDTPPGLGDELLDLATLIPWGEVILVTLPNRLSLTSIKRMIGIFRDQIKLIGVIENMWRQERGIRDIIINMDLKYLGYIPYVDRLDDLIEKFGLEGVYKKFFSEYLSGIIFSIL